MNASDGKERELKLALADGDAYRKLCGFLKRTESEEEQSNYYFDFQGQLRALGYLLRLRLEGEVAMLTLKGKATHQRGIFVADELEFQVSVDQALEVIAGQSPLDRLGTPVVATLTDLLGSGFQAHCWGVLENLRRRYRVGDDLLLEVDKTSFPDGSRRYEVEVESSDPESLRQQVESLLAEAGVHWREQELTKSEELCEVLQRIEEEQVERGFDE